MLESRKIISIGHGRGRSEESDVSWYRVGNSGITEIKYNEPRGEGDSHYCDVFHEDGTVARCFDLYCVIFDKEEN